jgi:AcrR family transcriptional regulator
VPTKQTDPRFQRTRAAITAALGDLLSAMPLRDISITGLVAQAGITRPTFYQHFPDIPAAARHAAFERLAAAFPFPEPLPGDGALAPEEVRAWIAREARPVLQHLSDHRTFYLHVVEGAGSLEFYDTLVAFIAERMLPGPLPTLEGVAREDVAALRAGGVMWVVLGWLRSDPMPSPAQMAERIAATAASAP